MKIHGVFLLKKQFGKGFREIFEGSPVFHPTLREIYRIESVIFTACEILSNCKEFVYVVATLREQSIFIIARSSFVDIARDCRYGELFKDIVNYHQFDECKHMRDFAVIAVCVNYCDAVQTERDSFEYLRCCANYWRLSKFAGESISFR